MAPALPTEESVFKEGSSRNHIETQITDMDRNQYMNARTKIGSG